MSKHLKRLDFIRRLFMLLVKFVAEIFGVVDEYKDDPTDDANTGIK